MKNYGIIISKKDPAGINIFNNLISNFNFKKITMDLKIKNINKIKKYENIDINYNDLLIDEIYVYNNLTLILTNKESIFCDYLDYFFGFDVFIFATKHKAIKNNSCFCVHTPGNFNKADYGGIDYFIGYSAIDEIAFAFKYLEKINNLPKFNQTLECTHHGPIIYKSSMFIEVGSTELEWENKKAGLIIAKTIIKMTSITYNNFEKQILFGIGGPHYCNNFNKLLDFDKYLIGHVCPKYNLEFLNEELILQGIQKSNYFENNQKNKQILVAVDFKGLGKFKEKIINMLEKLNLNYEKIAKLKKKY
ncbi:MAG: D-aminoacyl-tRNA deacylase [Nanoarchaeota archaeon]